MNWNDRDVSPAYQERSATEAAGGQAVIDHLFRPLLTPAFRLALFMLRDPAAAEDAVQEAALKSWRKLSTLKPGKDPLPWFLGFVANECRNARRSRWRTVLPLTISSGAIARETLSSHDPDLIRALSRLTYRDRLIVSMFYYLDLPLDDIAAATRSRKAAVRSRLYRAVETLRKQMRDE